MFWARWTFGFRSFHAAASPTAGGVVTTGPYRYWRHPIYAAILFFLWAGVIDHVVAPSRTTPGPLNLSASVIIIAAIVATLATAVRIRAEERLLLATYPDYALYAARTKRLIPFVF
jgi:protein-S-isoprenylcysteine O-methyltransferase Ste14